MKEYTNQELLDICDRMPAEQKGCRVSTNEDGTGNVDLGDFIINYGRALLEDIAKVPSKGRRRKPSKSVQNEAGSD